MTDTKALIERLEEHAKMHDELVILGGKEQERFAEDLRLAIDALQSLAQPESAQEPVGEVKQSPTGQIYIEWTCGAIAMLRLVGAKLYAAPLSDKAKQDRITDTDRINFIEKRARCDPKMDGHHVWWPTTFNNALRGCNLREAIDAALEAEVRGKRRAEKPGS
jgi:hypothetical protein